MTRTLPPVELTPHDLASARVSLSRLAHNALAVALLASRNAPRPGVHQQAPNSGSRISTPGGSEQQVLEGLEIRILEAHIQQGMAKPGTEARAFADSAVQRLEAHKLKIRAQLDALPGGDRVYPGLRDTYTVTVPALHARVEGVAWVSDLTRLSVQVDPLTPRYEEYLGREEWPGHQGSGLQPLYKVRGDRTRLLLASEAQPWHTHLMTALWGDMPLPELRLAVEGIA